MKRRKRFRDKDFKKNRDVQIGASDAGMTVLKDEQQGMHA